MTGSTPSLAVGPPGADGSLLSHYDYDLPPAAIAQRPAARRDLARLLVVDAGRGVRAHACVRHLGRFLRPGDVLVVNDSLVSPARLRGHKVSGGGVEVLLLRREGPARWLALLRASRRPEAGAVLRFAEGLEATVLADQGDGRVGLGFRGVGDIAATLARIGELPLPPYIRRPDGPDAADRERYQTVFARLPGSVAAPTAGLHFTRDLLETLQRRGIGIATVTLHVGAATFQPIRTEDLTRHSLDLEEYEIPTETAAQVEATRARGGAVIAVGTTTTRALEAAADGTGRLRTGSGEARLFIRPGYRFRVIDGLVTNFHLPRSSLLVLVAAVLGLETTLGAYAEAVANGYRFYSYGDAMLALGRAREGGDS